MSEEKRYILAIDPGAARSAFVKWDIKLNRVVEKSDDPGGITEKQRCTIPNEKISRVCLYNYVSYTTYILIERVGARYMPLGKETRDTIEFIGWLKGFMDAQKVEWNAEWDLNLIERDILKRSIPGGGKGSINDSGVRAYLIDTYGKPGTKITPGPLYGLKGDQWQAMLLIDWKLKKLRGEI